MSADEPPRADNPASARGPRPRLRRAAFAALAAGVVVLVASADGSAERALFFGKWRTSDVAVAAAFELGGLLALLFAARPKWVPKLAALAATLGLGWLALEGLALAGRVDYAVLLGLEEPVQLGRVALPHHVEHGTAREDIAQARGLDWPRLPYDYRADQRGFRNAVDRSGADVVLLGDSVLVAGLVPFAETVCGRLEVELGKTVMNVALCGLGPQAERDLLLASDVDLRGSRVLHVLFEGNDLVDSADYRAHPPQSEGKWRARLRRSFFFNALMALQRASDPRRLAPTNADPGASAAVSSTWKDARCAAQFRSRTFLFAWGSNSFRGFEGELPEIQSTCAEVERAVRERGGRYALVLMPCKLRVLGPHCQWPAGSPLQPLDAQLGPLPAEMARWAEQRGIPCLDLTAALAAAVAAGRSPWFAGDTHPNAEGHAVLAAALAAWPVLRDGGD